MTPVTVTDWHWWQLHRWQKETESQYSHTVISLLMSTVVVTITLVTVILTVRQWCQWHWWQLQTDVDDSWWQRVNTDIVDVDSNNTGDGDSLTVTRWRCHCCQCCWQWRDVGDADDSDKLISIMTTW